MPGYSYIKDPAAIYAESFARVRTAGQFGGMTPAMADVAVRLVHACGMPDLLADLAYSGRAVDRAVAALMSGCPVFCDCEMVASGITRRFLPQNNEVIVTLNDPQTKILAQQQHTTRSAAAIDLWGDNLAGAVVAIGNAPTALFRLLERIHYGAAAPAVILGFPVGFVGAAESKQALATGDHGLDFIVVHGTRGGSALAAAAVNALALGAKTS
ncbi:precorrin-8X methylmutase [Alphaproteobacteria bacterium]|nr:precorrin-8X methylmutase [Alphaproteobacteria bacterium]